MDSREIIIADYITRLGEVEKQSLIIMMECMVAGGTYTEAAEAAAQYLFSQPGHEAQARATLALAEQWTREKEGQA